LCQKYLFNLDDILKIPSRYKWLSHAMFLFFSIVWTFNFTLAIFYLIHVAGYEGGSMPKQATIQAIPNILMVCT
jgi:hypothetical protein